MRAVRRRTRRLLAGEAGPAPALVLAGVALVIAFIAIAGPRALVAAGNSATRQAMAQAPALDTGAVFTGDLQAGPGTSVLSAADIHKLTRSFGAALPLPQLFPPARRWAGISVPTVVVMNAAPSALAPKPPLLEVTYREGLASYSRVVAGSLPSGPAAVTGGTGKHPGSVTLTVAVTRAVARRFSLRVGSLLDLGTISAGGPRTLLRVTGIVQPTSPASAFWLADPLISAPVKEGAATNPYWVAGVITGPADLPAVSAAFVGAPERASWFFPLTADLTTADVSSVESGVSALASSSRLRAAQAATKVGIVQHTAVSTGLANGLATFTAQWRSTARTDSILAVGLFAAGLLLLLVCSGLAVEAFRSELALLRVRGGSMAQLARRMLVRSCLVALPAAVAGAVLAVAVLPGGNSQTGWVLGVLAALTAICGAPVIGVLAHRGRRLRQTGRGSDVIAARHSLRRLVAEIAVVVVAVAAITDVRLRGAGTSTTGPYLSSSAVLVAVVVWLIVNRAYRVPLRAAASVAAGRRGPVGAVGLARAAAARAVSLLPALALTLTLTLTVFGAMVMTSIATGQQAGSWRQVGADAKVAAPGTSPITADELRALRRVPGVQAATSIFPVAASGYGAVVFGGGSSLTVGLAVVDPLSYAAYSARTPWPVFPAGALAKPRSGRALTVPVLASPGVAAKLCVRGLNLQLSGYGVNVRIAGTLAATAAVPSGGDFLILPRWAASALPSLLPPNTALLAGQAINVRQLRATAARLMPGGQVTLRGQILSQLTTAPALHLSEELYLAGALAAAVLSALAVIFALAGSARGRAAMTTRLAALGMRRRQALILGCTDAVPLVSVAVVGTAAASLLLIAVIGPVLGLNVFTGASAPIALRPTWAGVVAPLAGTAILAVVFLAFDGARAWRRDIGAAIRQEEAD